MLTSACDEPGDDRLELPAAGERRQALESPHCVGRQAVGSLGLRSPQRIRLIDDRGHSRHDAVGVTQPDIQGCADSVRNEVNAAQVHIRMGSYERIVFRRFERVARLAQHAADLPGVFHDAAGPRDDMRRHVRRAGAPRRPGRDSVFATARWSLRPLALRRRSTLFNACGRELRRIRRVAEIIYTFGRLSSHSGLPTLGAGECILTDRAASVPRHRAARHRAAGRRARPDIRCSGADRDGRAEPRFGARHGKRRTRRQACSTRRRALRADSRFLTMLALPVVLRRPALLHRCESRPPPPRSNKAYSAALRRRRATGDSPAAKAFLIRQTTLPCGGNAAVSAPHPSVTPRRRMHRDDSRISHLEAGRMYTETRLHFSNQVTR